MEATMFLFNRAFLNPVLVITGILTLMTGLFLFFHIKTRLIVQVHEIGGLVFAVACLFHIIVNWKPLLHSMKGSLLRRTVATLLIITIAGLAYFGATADPHKERELRHKERELRMERQRGH